MLRTRGTHPGSGSSLLVGGRVDCRLGGPMNNPFETIRSVLVNSYKHRTSPGTACAACGATNRPCAFHLVEYAQPSGRSVPPRFVAMSESGGTIRGAFVFCDRCAPACRKCELPRVSGRIRAVFKGLRKSLDSSETCLQWGSGRCEHFHFLGRWPI